MANGLYGLDVLSISLEGELWRGWATPVHARTHTQSPFGGFQFVPFFLMPSSEREREHGIQSTTFPMGICQPKSNGIALKNEVVWGDRGTRKKVDG